MNCMHAAAAFPSKGFCAAKVARSSVVVRSSNVTTGLGRRAVLGVGASQLLLPGLVLADNRTDDALLAGARAGAGGFPVNVDVDSSKPAKKLAKPVSTVPRATLPDGLGVSKCSGDAASDNTSGAACMADFDKFTRAGITTMDTADIYGPSEALIGQYLRLAPWQRENMEVLTKITVAEEDLQHLSRDMLEYRVKASMRRLGLSYLDLVQLHWENFGFRGYVDAALWLADMQGQGLIKHIGLTNFDAPHMIQVLDAGVIVASNQVQYSVMDRRSEIFLQDLCTKHKVALLPYGVLGGGFLSERYLGQPAKAARLNTMSKQKYGAQITQLGGWQWLQDLLQTLHILGEKHNVSASTIAIRWVLQQRNVPAAIIGARNALHVHDLQRAFTFELDDMDLLDLDAAYEGATQPQHDCFVWERGGPW